MSELSSEFVNGSLTQGIDRRIWARYSGNLSTSCRIKASLNEDIRPARVRNISAGGISLIVACSAEPETIVPLVLRSTLRDFSRALSLRVLYCVEHPGGDWILGGEFVEPLGEEELRHFLGWRETPPVPER